MSEQKGAADSEAHRKRPDHNEAAVIREVRRAVREIEYGSVLIKIHQGEVVGIETSTKVRLAES
jgi:hypothetical protein